MNLKLFIILFTSLFLLAATDINNGKDKSATCVACHGKEGNSQVGLWPSIAGQNKNYLMKQLKLIKKGERAILEMNGLLDGFSDADLEDISGSSNLSPMSDKFKDSLNALEALGFHRSKAFKALKSLENSGDLDKKLEDVIKIALTKMR